MFKNFKQIYSLLDEVLKKNFYLLFPLILVNFFLEIIGLGIVIPLVSLLISEDLNKYFIILNNFFFNFDNYSRILLIKFFLAFLVSIFLLKTIFSITFIWFLNNVLGKTKVYFINKFYNFYITNNWEIIKNKNSSEITRNLRSSNVLGLYLSNFIQLISDILIFTGIILILIFADPLSSIIVICTFGAVALIYLFLFKSKLKKYGANIFQTDKEILNWIKQSIGSLKELRIYNLKNYFKKKIEYLTNYEKINYVKQATIQNSHRYVFEFVIVLIFSVIILVLLQKKNITEILPLLGLYGVASFRLVPVVNRLLNSYQIIIYNFNPVRTLLDEYSFLKEDKKKFRTKDNRPIHFEKNIMIKNLNFSYGNVQVFKDANFYLNKGEKIILVGENGTGKSTLVNILCGLLKPKSGQIVVDHKEVDLDNINWQNKIGYVPQNMYMFDLPLFNNICLGKDVLSKEDIKRCEEVIERVNLSKYMKNINESTKIDIGEDGSKLSGGQIQRIGIARALFRYPEILILDEATSSIDESTENDILDEIFKINDDLTIVLITHKIKNLSFSKKVYEFKNFSINKYCDE